MSAKLLGLLLLALAVLPVMADDEPGSIPVSAFISPNKGDHNDPLVRYKYYTRSAIARIWRREMMTNQTSLWFGEVRIRCTVHSDGSITDPTVVVGESCGLLKTVSMHSLIAAAPFHPFDTAVMLETGNSYVDEISFWVTRRQRTAPTADDRAYGGEKSQAGAPGMD